MSFKEVKRVLNELSAEKLKAYTRAARRDYQNKIRSGDMLGSIKRANNVQKAEIKAFNKEEVAVNNVGGGKIDGLGIGPKGEPGATKRKNPKLLKDVLKRNSVRST